MRASSSTGDGVEVVVPRRFPLRDVEGFVEEKRPWIERTLRRMRESEDEFPPARLEDGGELPYLGERLGSARRAASAAGTRPHVARRAGELRVMLPLGGDLAGALEALVSPPGAGGGRRRASTPPARAPARATPRCQSAGSARAGPSCSSTGAMSFNWRLLLAPAEILDYVVEHEVAHLEVHDHSRALLGAAGLTQPGLARTRALAAPPRPCAEVVGVDRVAVSGLEIAFERVGHGPPLAAPSRSPW